MAWEHFSVCLSALYPSSFLQIMMSAAQTMEAVNMTASTLMVLMSVGVEMGTECPAITGAASVSIMK